MDSRYRDLPSVDRLATRVLTIDPDIPRSLAMDGAREILNATRGRLATESVDVDLDALARDVREQIRQRVTPSLRPLINATGVVLHTNLGRAPVSDTTAKAMADTASSYSNLEFDLDSGQRGSRSSHARDLLRELTGAEDALVVNNNAGALLLAVTALAHGRDVIVSRGQAVEIGGGFRIPDVTLQSGAHLIEVGTTNRTYLADYQGAITPATALLLRVHPSNFRILGFVNAVGIVELAALGINAGVGVLDDVGSGALIDPTPFGLRDEPLVQESVRAGASVVCFSGDKLLGGPQGGLLVGTSSAIIAMRRHPLARAFRIDKASLAGLEATLRHYQLGEALVAIPVWRMISLPLSEVERRARVAAGSISSPFVEAVQMQSLVGGGSLPGECLPSWGLRLLPPSEVAVTAWSADQVAGRLRRLPRPIVARVEHNSVVLDLRTVDPRDDQAIVLALADEVSRLGQTNG